RDPGSGSHNRSYGDIAAAPAGFEIPTFPQWSTAAQHTRSIFVVPECDQPWTPGARSDYGQPTGRSRHRIDFFLYGSSSGDFRPRHEEPSMVMVFARADTQEKGFPMWDFTFPDQEKRFPPRDFAFPDRENRFPVRDFLFLHCKSDFPIGISRFLIRESDFLHGISLFRHGKNDFLRGHGFMVGFAG